MIRSTETGQTREIRPNLRYFNVLKWAPDGRSILTQGTTNKGRQGVFRLDLQTGDAAPIVLSEPGERLRAPNLSPDGTTLYYSHSSGKTKSERLVTRDLATGAERVLVANLAGPPNLSLSHDGGSLAYTAFDELSKSTSLFVIPRTGGESRELLRVSNTENIQFTTWSSDGRFLVFNKRRLTGDASNELWRVDARSGEARKLELGEKSAAYPGEFSLHTDGKRIAMAIGEVRHEVWALENFLPPANGEK